MPSFASSEELFRPKYKKAIYKEFCFIKERDQFPQFPQFLINTPHKYSNPMGLKRVVTVKTDLFLDNFKDIFKEFFRIKSLNVF